MCVKDGMPREGRLGADRKVEVAGIAGIRAVFAEMQRVKAGDKPPMEASGDKEQEAAQSRADQAGALTNAGEDGDAQAMYMKGEGDDEEDALLIDEKPPRTRQGHNNRKWL